MNPHKPALIGQVDVVFKIGAQTFPTTLDVFGRPRQAFPGSRETPAEPGGHDIDRVMLGKTDIRDDLPQGALEKITEEIAP